MKNLSYEDRLFEKVEKITESGCWVWTGAMDSAGYGRMAFNNRIDGAHRVAYQLFIGPIEKGLFICHHCDVKLCVRPDHLFAGTQKHNIQDCVRKGRLGHQRATGEIHGAAKLSNFLVKRIRQMYSSKLYSQTELARLFNIGQTAISSIVTRQTWRKV